VLVPSTSSRQMMNRWGDLEARQEAFVNLFLIIIRGDLDKEGMKHTVFSRTFLS
jgi:hypothetical protein